MKSRQSISELRPPGAIVFATAIAIATLVLAGEARAQEANVAVSTPSRSGDEWMQEGRRLAAAGNVAGATAAFENARRAGADTQTIDLELGYLEMRHGHRGAARGRFEAAARGGDRNRSRQARAELRYLPAHWWADAYAETWAWTRVVGDPSSDLVPTLRLRGFWRPVLDVDFNLYLYAQATRDINSQGNGTVALSRIFADNYALTGAGAMIRFWRGRVSFFVQGGPAINLLDDGRPRVAADVRAGAIFAVDSPHCFPTPARPFATLAGACAELYSQAVWLSRFNNDVVGFVRGRLGYTVMVTGPVAWQPLLESRLLLGLNKDYWNNLAEAGVVHRWRLLAPIGIDVNAGAHVGTYLGLHGVDPLPNQTTYVELRLLLTGYWSI